MIIASRRLQMKKTFIVLFLILALVPSAFGQFRFEIGANAPVAAGFITGDGTLYGDYLDVIGSAGLIPIPNLALLLQANLGGVLKIGAGVKAQSILVASIAYPTAQIELSLGALSIDAGIGGLYFGYYALGNLYGLETQDLLLPELSVWLGLGKRHSFRIGGGAIGILSSSLDISEVPFVGYAGFKVVLE